MRHFIVASHGRLAEGMLDAVRLILGEVEDVRCYGAYIDPGEVMEDSVSRLLAAYPLEDEVIVVTDVMGGSVCNQFVRHLDRKNLHILAGMNLGFLLGLFLGRDLPLPELIEEVVNSGKNSICYCNRMVEEVMDEEFIE